MSKQHGDGLIVGLDPLLGQQRSQIAALALKNRIPTIGATQSFADAGMLMSYGQNVSESFRRAATYVDKILKGAKAGDGGSGGQAVQWSFLDRQTQTRREIHLTAHWTPSRKNLCSLYSPLELR
jgi:ABC-type uncharacterized transport system substrate-binding protein